MTTPTKRIRHLFWKYHNELVEDFGIDPDLAFRTSIPNAAATLAMAAAYLETETFAAPVDRPRPPKLRIRKSRRNR